MHWTLIIMVISSKQQPLIYFYICHHQRITYNSDYERNRNRTTNLNCKQLVSQLVLIIYFYIIISIVKLDIIKLDIIKLDIIKLDSIKLDSIKLDSIKLDSIKLDSIISIIIARYHCIHSMIRVYNVRECALCL